MLLSDLVYDTRGDLPGAPDFAIRDAITRAAGQFFADSRCWIEQLDPIPLASGVWQYYLSLPSDALLLQIYNDGLFTGVKIDRCALEVLPEWKMFDASRTSVDTGLPRRCAVVTRDDTLMVWPTPGAAEVGKEIAVLAVLGLTREADEMPDQLGYRYREAIIALAKSRMMLTNGKEWSNPKQGDIEFRNYRRVVVTARAETHTGRYAEPQRLQFTPLA